MFSFEVLDSIIIGFLLFNLIGACGLAYRNYNRKFNLLYLALVCAILGFFICDLFFQSKRIYSIADFIIFEKGTNFFLLIVGIVLIQIVSTVTGYSKKWLNWCFTLPLIYFIIINAIWPYGFYYSNIEKIEMVQLVGGVLFNTAVGGTTINVAFISLYFILLGILVIRSTVFAFKRGIKSGGIILSAAFIPGIIFQFLSAVAFLMSGKINLVAILLSEFGLFYVTLLFGAKNFSDALDLVGATNSLVESEGRYRLLADHMTDTIWLMDMNLHPFYISPSVEKIRGYSIKELLEMPLDKHFTPSSLARAMDAYKKEMDYLKANPGHTFVVTLELEFCRKNGSTYWVENTFSLIRDSNGSPKAILAEGRDITFRKIADAKITQLSRAVEQSPVSIAIVNNEGVIIYANKKIAEEYENMPGVTTGERIYLLNLEVETENDLDIGMILKKGLEWQGEIHHGKSHGVIVWENVTISPIKDEAGSISQFLIIIENISRRKKLEANLIYEKERAQEMNRLKSSFLANMSHELRTPMIGILGYSETLMQEASDDEVKNTMEIIYRSASRLMDTLNLILHLSRIEAGKLDIEYTEFDVIKSIKDIFKLFAKLAEQKSLYLKLESEYSQLTIVSDAKLLREIISNLVNNGIKFTERGGVVVSVTAERTGSAKWLVLRISDTGMGIAKENQELIWEEFRQVSEGHNRSFEGTGLGLTITKRFVDKLKGSIVLESELHKGSVFILRFPLLAVNSSADTPEREATVVEVETPLRTNELPVILYVEDDVIAAQLVTKILRSICKVEVVATASAAIKRASEAHYAAILMDINLGRGEDGVQATKAIRQLQAYKNTPIVALTAYVMEGDKEEFLQAGCSHYLSKPFVSSELKSLMNSILPT